MFELVFQKEERVGGKVNWESGNKNNREGRQERRRRPGGPSKIVIVREEEEGSRVGQCGCGDGTCGARLMTKEAPGRFGITWDTGGWVFAEMLLGSKGRTTEGDASARTGGER